MNFRPLFRGRYLGDLIIRYDILVIIVEPHERRGGGLSDVLNKTIKGLSIKRYETGVASLMPFS